MLMTKGQVLGIKNERNDANLNPIFLVQQFNFDNKNPFQSAETESTSKSIGKSQIFSSLYYGDMKEDSSCFGYNLGGKF